MVSHCRWEERSEQGGGPAASFVGCLLVSAKDNYFCCASEDLHISHFSLQIEFHSFFTPGPSSSAVTKEKLSK